MARQRQQQNQLTFTFEQSMLPLTPEAAAIIQAHLPPPLPLPLILSKPVSPVAWDFVTNFPPPLQQAVDAGLFGAEFPTPKQIEELHLEHANELFGILNDLAVLEDAKESGTDPSTGKRPRSEAVRKRLAERLERESVFLAGSFDDLIAVFADGFGQEAADACAKWVCEQYHLRTMSNVVGSDLAGIPVPTPLPSAVQSGAFGRDENDDPIEPQPDEVREISVMHGERLAELFVALELVNKRLFLERSSGQTKSIPVKERLTCQIQGLLALYSEDFGEVAARHLESWARAHMDRDEPPHATPLPAPMMKYDPGHPWHYLFRGDAQQPMPVEEIPHAESDGRFIGKLPKDFKKRQSKLSQLLGQLTRQLDDDKARYKDLVERGPGAISDYDRDIAYGGDMELAVASSLALKFNHISNGLGRVRWLRTQLGLPVAEMLSTNSYLDSGHGVPPVAVSEPSRTNTNGDSAIASLDSTAAASHAVREPVSPLPVVGSVPLRGTNNGGVMQIENDTAPSKPPSTIEKLDKLHENVEQAIDRLAESLEAGRSDTFKAWLTTMSRFHDYSFNNQMLIAFQRPDATHVAGFHAWKKFNRLVNKGEKGIMILAPVTRPIAKVQEQDEQGNSKERTVRRLVNTKLVYVFDVSQTHGDPLPEFATVAGDAATHLPALKELITSRGIELIFADRISGGAQGRSEGGRISCINGLTNAEEFRTLAHELAHELLHRGERREETNRRTRELEAESVAFVVCTAVGLDARQCSTDYIHLYRGNKQLLLESLQFIRQVSSDILTVLLPKSHNHVAS